MTSPDVPYIVTLVGKKDVVVPSFPAHIAILENVSVYQQWYEPRDERFKVKSSKGNPGSTDLISDR